MVERSIFRIVGLAIIRQRAVARALKETKKMGSSGCWAETGKKVRVGKGSHSNLRLLSLKHANEGRFKNHSHHSPYGSELSFGRGQPSTINLYIIGILVDQYHSEGWNIPTDWRFTVPGYYNHNPTHHSPTLDIRTCAIKEGQVRFNIAGRRLHRSITLAADHFHPH